MPTPRTQSLCREKAAFEKLQYLNEYIVCSSCQEVLEDTHIVPGCLHRFCRRCSKCIRQCGDKCPKCKEPILNEAHLRKDENFDALVRGVIITLQLLDGDRNRTEEMRGQSTEVLDQLLSLDKLTVCSSCEEVLEDTNVARGCLHRFCRRCSKCLQLCGGKCPACKEPISTEQSLKRDEHYDAVVQAILSTKHMLQLAHEGEDGESSINSQDNAKQNRKEGNGLGNLEEVYPSKPHPMPLRKTSACQGREESSLSSSDKACEKSRRDNPSDPHHECLSPRSLVSIESNEGPPPRERSKRRSDGDKGEQTAVDGSSPARSSSYNRDVSRIKEESPDRNNPITIPDDSLKRRAAKRNRIVAEENAAEEPVRSKRLKDRTAVGPIVNSDNLEMDEVDLIVAEEMEDKSEEDSSAYSKETEKVADEIAGRNRHKRNQNFKGLCTWTNGCTYEGELADGIPNGEGVCTWTDGTVYKGHFKNGIREGMGKETKANGDVYIGEWLDGKRHGNGEEKRANGGEYQGEYKNGKKHGKGTYSWPGGSIYCGQWEKGEMHGKGKITCSDGNIFEGDYKSGKKHGEGKVTYVDGGTYEGEFRNDTWNGKGRRIWADGGFYEGDWLDGKRHGEGKVTYADGGVYEGGFKDDSLNGKGKRIWMNGDKYEGDWVDGKRHGKGKVTYSNGGVYEGDFKDDYLHGRGKRTWANGDKYDGDWVKGTKNGCGSYFWPDGGVYDGEWVNDKRSGKGRRAWPRGFVFDGEFKDDKKHGNGKFTWPDGGAYEGGFKNDFWNGKGKRTWSNGDSYEGGWKDSKRHGKGKLIRADGTVFEGKWAKDKYLGK